MKRQSENYLETTQNLSFNKFSFQTENMSEGMNFIVKKKQSFHEQIRKQQRFQIKKAKRAILIQNMNKINENNPSSWDYKQKNLLQLYSCIRRRQNIKQNIYCLINLLALDKPFNHYSESKKQALPGQIQQYSTQLVNLLLFQTIPQFPINSPMRIHCYNALSNLFADCLCPNAKFISVVIDTISNQYDSVQKWGIDNQMVQIYYMIGHLMRKKIVNSSLLSLENLLEWCEEGIDSLPSDPLQFIVFGLIQLFGDVDDMFNSKGNRSYFTEHLRHSREILVEKLVKRFIETAQGGKLKKNGNLSLDPFCMTNILEFFIKNKQYLIKSFIEWNQSQETKQYPEYFIKKILLLLNQQTMRLEVTKFIGTFLNQFLRFYPVSIKNTNNICNGNYASSIIFPQSSEFQSNKIDKQKQSQKLNETISKTHIFLLTKCFEEILRMICLQQVQVKLIYLNLLFQLLKNSRQSLSISSDEQEYKVFNVLMNQRELQNVLIDLLGNMTSKLKDIQILQSILNIYHMVIHIGQGKLGLRMKQKIILLLEDQGSKNLPQKFFQMMDEQVNWHQELIAINSQEKMH